MSAFQRCTGDNIVEVLRRYAAWLYTQDPEYRAVAAENIDGLLDCVLDDDGFGTEGQCDPRGDHRD